jgi:hypothetical protein
VVTVSPSNEAKGLQAGALKLRHRLQHFRHAVDGTGPGVEGDLHEIAGGELVLQLEQPTRDGDGLEFGSRALAAFGKDGGTDRSVELHARRPLAGIGLGEESHSWE